MTNNIEKKVRRSYVFGTKYDFETLTFEELNVGDKYIEIPLPGDKKDNLGYIKDYPLYIKIKNKYDSPNSRRLSDKKRFVVDEETPVLRIK